MAFEREEFEALQLQFEPNTEFRNAPLEASQPFLKQDFKPLGVS